MNEMGEVETRDEVMAAARAAGFFPSEPQLKAWRRAGLIPRPLDQHGRGRKRGSTTTYPPGTAAQLVALGQLHQRERQLGPLAFRLWWQGFPIPMTAIRQALHQVIDEVEIALSNVIADGELTELGWEGLERLERDSRLPSTLKRARKRAGKARMSTVGRLLILGAGGAFPGWGATPKGGPSDRDLVTAAVGISVLNSVLSAFNAKERIPDDAETALSALSDHVNPNALRAVLVNATDADLETARSELGEFSSLLADILYLSEKTPDLLGALRQRNDQVINPLSLFGLQAFGMIVQQLAPDWRKLRATDAMLLFLAGVSLCRRPATRRGLRAIAGSGDELHLTRIEAERYFSGALKTDAQQEP